MEYFKMLEDESTNDLFVHSWIRSNDFSGFATIFILMIASLPRYSTEEAEREILLKEKKKIFSIYQCF